MNRLKLAFISLLLAVIVVAPAHSQNKKVVKKIIEIGQSDNQTMQHLDVFSNRFGGRLIGSDAYDNAADWAVSKFKEWGLEAELDYSGELPVGFNRGPWFGRMLSDNGMQLHFATPSYTSGTKGVQKGHVVIEPKTQRQFDRMKGKLKGAWVLIGGKNSGWPIDISAKADHLRDSLKSLNADIEKKNNEARSYNWSHRGEKRKEMLPLNEEPALFYSQMAEAGILGIIQSTSNPIRALYDRKNLPNMTFDNLPTVPDIKLDEHQYAIIYQMAKERQRFELEFDIRNHFKMGPVKYSNVIGMIKGTKYPDEYVIIGGHLDAFDVATGGIDCGTGIAVAMEAARLIMESGAKPKRTILFCLWAGEEFGLLGSKSWVLNNEDKWDKISNYFNRDGGPTVANSLSVPEAMYDDFEKICKPLNDINPDFPFTLKKRTPRKQPKVAGGTDSGSFSVVGVPTSGFGTGDPKGYDFNYGEIWHTERDLYNMSIPEYMDHSSIVTAIVALGLANLDHLLSREGYFLPEEEKKK